MTTANAYELSPAGQCRQRHYTTIQAEAAGTQRSALHLIHSELQDPVLNALPAAVILLDQRGMVYQANPAALSMLGEPLVGQLWFNLIKRCFRPRSDDGLEVSLQDGRRVKLEISALLSKTAYTQPGQLIMLTDLTQTRQLQSRLSHMQRLSALGKMMASLAHQIRTPLSAALLYAQNLANPRITLQQQQQFQHKLQSRLQDLEQQLNDMLLFARPDSAQAVSVVSTTELAAAVQAAAEACISAAGARLTVQLPEQPLYILGNQNALCGALMNLIQNSLQAAGAAAQIALGMAADSDKAGYLSISVSDNGPGVPAQLQADLFEPFVTGRADGNGLGLAVVQAVATSHQGTVRYSAAADGGACFQLTLPQHQLKQTQGDVL